MRDNFWETLDTRYQVDPSSFLGRGVNYALDEYWNEPRKALSYFKGEDGLNLQGLRDPSKKVNWGGLYKYSPDSSSGVLRTLGHTANLAGTAFDVAQPFIRMGAGQQWDDAIVGSAGDIGGSIAGGALGGAALGSMFGPVGTVVGGLAGTVAGGIAGGNAANWAWGKVTGDPTWGGWRPDPNMKTAAQPQRMSTPDDYWGQMGVDASNPYRVRQQAQKELYDYYM